MEIEAEEQRRSMDNKMKVAVSVIIPVYNAERYIEKCIESVINQTFQDYEGIIINDGSTDDSKRIIEKYVESFPGKLKTFYKENGGLSSARNLGLEKASGKYVTFLDADDYLDDKYLEILINAAEENRCDMVCSGQYKVKENGDVIKSIIYHPQKGKCLTRRLNISGKIYRSNYINKWGARFPDGKTYEDNSFNLQMLFLSNRNYFLEYAGYYQVVHEGSITSKRIEIDKLPLEEWENCVKKVLGNIDNESTHQLFEFTVISFFTYFLLVRNRKREYLENKEKRKNQNVIEIADFFENIINTYFLNARNNPYTAVFKYKELEWKQRLGVKIFVIVCQWRKLTGFTRMFYKFLG